MAAQQLFPVWTHPNLVHTERCITLQDSEDSFMLRRPVTISAANILTTLTAFHLAKVHAHANKPARTNAQLGFT